MRISSIEEAAAFLREHDGAVRPRGGGTKLGWLKPGDAAELDTRGLDRLIAHNAGDFTAILEAGVPLRVAQATFARAGQMLAIDPPLGDDDAATIGGIVAANDSGPLRHRYGGMRDLVIGMTVVLSDGTVAKSGGQVIKNVAGYDLAKLFTGSFGTLGLIARVAVRLHPRPQTTASLVLRSENADTVVSAAAHLRQLPLEADCFDVSWARERAQLAIRFAGAAAAERARAAARRLTAACEIVADDEPVWAALRGMQRARGVVVKVAGQPTDLAAMLSLARQTGSTLVSRAALGLYWFSLPTEMDAASVRRAIGPRACTVLDGAAQSDEPWPALEPGVLALMQRVKMRFDPARSFNPGVFVGGI